MLGALSRTARTPRMPPGMRRRFDAGGGTGDDQQQPQSLPPPMLMDPGTGNYIPPEALPGGGALSQQPGPPQQGQTGALSASPDPNAAGKMQAIQGGINTLKDQQGMENALSVHAGGRHGPWRVRTCRCSPPRARFSRRRAPEPSGSRSVRR